MNQVLVVTAHPDDADFVCGGTVARFVSEGSDVTYLLATLGEAGESHGPATSASLRDIRRTEQSEACRVLGVSQVYFLNCQDGRVTADWNLRVQIADYVRRIRPNVVVTHSPTMNFSSIRFSHPDHLAVGTATVAAVYPEARSGGLPHIVSEIWFFGHEHPNHFVDISSYFEQKMAAISRHRSQLSADRDNHAFFRDWAAELGEQSNLSAGLAEAYFRMNVE